MCVRACVIVKWRTPRSDLFSILGTIAEQGMGDLLAVPTGKVSLAIFSRFCCRLPKPLSKSRKVSLATCNIWQDIYNGYSNFPKTSPSHFMLPCRNLSLQNSSREAVSTLARKTHQCHLACSSWLSPYRGPSPHRLQLFPTSSSTTRLQAPTPQLRFPNLRVLTCKRVRTNG